ncbi:MAG: GNAT family N-acetyltransferase [Streptosporangiaceae bacterium]
MPDIRQLIPAEWRMLREVRLRALRDSPRSFLSTYELESAYDEPRWRREFHRGHWTIGAAADRAVGLLGVTRGSDVAPDERYLEYLWIAPGHRRSGLGRTRALLT